MPSRRSAPARYFRAYSDNTVNDVNKLAKQVETVRAAVEEAVGRHQSASSAGDERQTAGEIDDSENESLAGCEGKLKHETAQDLQGFTYLQPYVTIALANLLVAHGSPDEAIDVMTQWLYLWRCARGTGSSNGTRQRLEGCKFGPLPEADWLPEWFGIRAEFDLNVLLYQQAGEGNIVYRDFLRDHAKHFADYMATVGISIPGELQNCGDHKSYVNAETNAASGSLNIRASMLRSLLNNEDTLLRTELHFLGGSSWVEMENLDERGLALTRFRMECVLPEGGTKDQQDASRATLADYKITSGLLALAIADRLGTSNTSADERARAAEIKNVGKQQLRTGFRQLVEFRDADRKTLSGLPWQERVFTVSRWEESCSLAERAIRQLDESGS